MNLLRKLVHTLADRALIRINARLDRQYKTAVQDLAVAGAKLTACRQERDRAMAELADALVHVGELTLSNGQIALVEFAQIVADMHDHTDPLLVSRNEPRVEL